MLNKLNRIESNSIYKANGNTNEKKNKEQNIAIYNIGSDLKSKHL